MGSCHSPSGSPRPADSRAVALMAVLCGIWSLQQVSLKAIAEQASPMLMVALRSLVALLLLSGLRLRRGAVVSGKNWRPGAVVGALFGLEYLLVAEALRLTQASHVVIFLYTAPIVAALAMHWRLPDERLSALQWAGIALAFGGIALAFLGGTRGPADGVAGRALLGDALALAGGVAWGATTVTIRCSALSSAPPAETLAYQLLGAPLLLLPACGLMGQWRFEPSSTVWAHLAFQGVVVSFASLLAWFWLLRRYRASQLGAFAFLTPLFGVVLGVVLLGESLEPPFVAGGVLVLAGIGLVSGPAGWARRLGTFRRLAQALRRQGHLTRAPSSSPRA